MSIENIGRKTKKWMTEELINLCQDAKSIFIISFSDLDVIEQEEIRNRLRQDNSFLMVVKNSICKKAFLKESYEQLLNFVNGPIAIVLGQDNSIKITKILVDFADEYPSFEIRGGKLAEEIYSDKKIKELAELPSREVLLSKIVGSINSPISKFVYVLDMQLKRVVYVLSQIKEKKEE